MGVFSHPVRIVKGHPGDCKEKKERQAISRRPLLFSKPSPTSYINPAIDFWAKERTFAGKSPM